MASGDTRSAAQRISDARTWLMENAPFFGAQALNFQPVEAPWHKTGGTDGTRLVYNPEWVATLSDVELGTFLAHEVGHCDLGHLWRKDGRPHREWNEACDYAVNQLLLDSQDGRVFKVPANWLLDPQYKGLDGEEIFARRRQEREEQERKRREEEEKRRQEQEQEQDEEPEEPQEGEGDDSEPSEDQDESDEPGDDDQDSEDGDQESEPGDDESDDGEPGEGEGQDGEPEDGEDEGEQPGADGRPEFLDPQDAQDGDQDGQGTGEPQDGEEGDEQGEGEAGEEGQDEPLSELDWQMIAEQATAVALKAGQVGAETAAQVRQAREQDPSCWEVLRRFLQQHIPNTESWVPPNRRFVHQGLYLPGQVREDMPGVRLIVDTSASVTRRMRELFRDHIQTILREYRPAYIEVLYADTAVQQVQVFSPDDELDLLDIEGLGTAFQPALDWEPQDDPEWDGVWREPPCCAVYLTDTYGYAYREPDFPVLWAHPEGVTPYTLPFGDFVKLSEWD